MIAENLVFLLPLIDPYVITDEDNPATDPTSN
jgi:hypothetical protein